MAGKREQPSGKDGKEKKRRRIPAELTERARELRRESTFPERLLWSRLRAGRAAGLKFRRQQALDPYFADFYCPELRLVVEIDGRTHIGRTDADEERTRHLEKRGLRVLRFTNDQVIRSVDAVVGAIRQFADEQKEAGTPSPRPLPGREKGKRREDAQAE